MDYVEIKKGETYVGKARKTKGREYVTCPNRNVQFVANEGDWIIELPDYEIKEAYKTSKDGKSVSSKREGDKFVVSQDVFEDSYTVVEKKASKSKEVANESKKENAAGPTI